MKFLLLLALTATTISANNVLLIIADDYGIDSQSLYNTTSGATAPTPNINALAAEGMRFANAYAYPVCSPTRACMLTGQFGFRTGIGNVVSNPAGNSLTAAALTLPEVITANPTLGIQCAHFGKWHLSSGKDTAKLPNTIGGWPHFSGSMRGVLEDYEEWPKVINGVTSTSTTYATTDLVNDAVTWINARTTANQPWVAWVAFNAPHPPFHNPPANLHSYGATISGVLNQYRAAVEAMDTEIGRLLRAVDPATTHIIFIGDNGTPPRVVQAPLDRTHAKNSLYEGGLRVPLVIRGPGITTRGNTSQALVHAVDLFSTILELAGVPLPKDVTLDSKSLKPLLTGETTTGAARLYAESFDQSTPTTGGQALRDERYKLISPTKGAEEFYDLKNDPAETKNLLAGGIPAMTATQQARYQSLRSNLGSYTNNTTPPQENSPRQHEAPH